ncbi:MAG: M48 family metalloprotease, partial [Candidatus Tectomicrobia bacterium]|nr:M48 family metalloprotease [Candidatus Tectomicrobia bacterium]
INGVGQKLVQLSEPRSFSYHFKVLDTEEENAFALPGGYIYITRGLLTYLNSEAQLAGILGHEIGHAASRHAAEMLTKSLGYQFLTLGALAAGATGGGNAGNLAIVISAMSQQILLGYGRENELQADELGMLYAVKAGYGPKGIVEFMRTLKKKEKLKAIEYHAFMASHPDTTVRVMKLEDMAESYESRQGNYKTRSKEFKDQLNGLTYGPKWDDKKIRIVIAHKGETLRDIAEKTMGNPVKAWNLALLNGLREDSPLEEGQLIKTIADTN